jgi:hypothetical protein
MNIVKYVTGLLEYPRTRRLARHIPSQATNGFVRNVIGNSFNQRYNQRVNTDALRVTRRSPSMLVLIAPERKVTVKSFCSIAGTLLLLIFCFGLSNCSANSASELILLTNCDTYAWK